LTRRKPTGFAQAKRHQMGNAKRPVAAVAVGLATRAGFSDMQYRVGTRVAIGRRIGRATDAHRVHDENKSACHRYLT
jgi:hypothetical protein